MLYPPIPGEHITIGICSPSHIPNREEYANTIAAIRARGYGVVEADRLYSDSHGYLAAPEERAADLNQLICDDRVNLILFGGGEGSAELLPYLDFAAIKRHPKCICSYSDGTTILDAITASAGLITYYGQAPYLFDHFSDYDRQHFMRHFVNGPAERHVRSGEWKILRTGTGEGMLIGGYLRNFALLLGSRYCPLDLNDDYVLFLEDHEMFGDVSYVAAMLANIEQSDFMPRVRGLLFGHYSVKRYPHLYELLRRVGERWSIPVVYCDDFGHGENHAILPIGCRCGMDAARETLYYR